MATSETFTRPVHRRTTPLDQPVELLVELPDDASGVLVAARERRRVADRAEVELLELAVQWVLLHPSVEDRCYGEASTFYVRGVDSEIAIAGDGAPQVAEFAVAEFAAAVGVSSEAGKHLLGQAVELAYRLPRLWRQVRAGLVPAWKARRVAAETIRLSPQAAAMVDAQVAAVTGKLTPAALDRLVNEAIYRHMPAELERLAAQSWETRHVTIHDQLVSYTGTMRVEADLDLADALDLDTAVAMGAQQRAALGSTAPLDVRRAQALGDLARGQVALDFLPRDDTPTVPAVTVKPRQVVLYAHLTDQALAGLDPVARLERGNMQVTVDQVKAWCGSPTTTQVVLTPVIDLQACRESSADHATGPIAEHIGLRDQTCVFPWCARQARGCDADHIHPRARGGPTCTCNLAPLCRTHHRLKTHSPWTYHVLDPGTYVWTSPHHYQYLRDPHGTRDITRDITRE